MDTLGNVHSFNDKAVKPENHESSSLEPRSRKFIADSLPETHEYPIPCEQSLTALSLSLRSPQERLRRRHNSSCLPPQRRPISYRTRKTRTSALLPVTCHTPTLPPPRYPASLPTSTTAAPQGGPACLSPPTHHRHPLPARPTRGGRGAVAARGQQRRSRRLAGQAAGSPGSGRQDQWHRETPRAAGASATQGQALQQGDPSNSRRLPCTRRGRCGPGRRPHRGRTGHGRRKRPRRAGTPPSSPQLRAATAAAAGTPTRRESAGWARRAIPAGRERTATPACSMVASAPCRAPAGPAVTAPVPREAASMQQTLLTAGVGGAATARRAHRGSDR